MYEIENGDDNNEKKQIYKKQLIIYLLVTNAVFFVYFIIINLNKKNDFSPYSPEITKIKIGDEKSAKIGIISDIQIDNKYNEGYYKYFKNNFYKTLKVLKKNNVDLIIIAGDITNDGQTANYISFKKIFNSIYDNEQPPPMVISIMGNHDYMDTLFNTNIQRQKKFYKFMNSYPFSHYIINNYNFIFWSNENLNYGDSPIENTTWIKSTLEKANKNKKSKGDPIFVISHIPPKNTVYGSEGMWGNQDIYDILKDYPEVICISGHSHYSLRNIKSIWQGSFTAINTQSICYVDIDDYYTNIMDVKMDSAKDDSMGLIAYLNQDNVIFDRIQFDTEKILEEKWKINFPIKLSDFQYTFDKRNKKIKPIFKDNIKITVEKINNKNYIVFNSASHVDYVYIYKIILKTKDKNDIFEYLFYSDYYKNEKSRKKIIKYELPKDLGSNQYNVEIYAIDSFDNISEPKIGVIDI